MPPDRTRAITARSPAICLRNSDAGGSANQVWSRFHDRTQWHVRKRREIHAGRALEQAQAELGHDGDKMVEDVGLYAFIVAPCRCAGKRIDFQRQAMLAGRDLPRLGCIGTELLPLAA